MAKKPKKMTCDRARLIVFASVVRRSELGLDGEAAVGVQADDKEKRAARDHVRKCDSCNRYRAGHKRAAAVVLRSLRPSQPSSARSR